MVVMSITLFLPPSQGSAPQYLEYRVQVPEPPLRPVVELR